uniref:YadA-like family protein n=1 Tax=Dialister succinatiphilus TaxID=487173 RepID=UPI003F806245
NKADIDTNKADIATNKADIATNKADIATNKADIATNKADIATNKADIATNKADIATNKSDIATNKSDIATNKADIATNKADIAQEVKNRTKAVADEAAARESGDNALQSQIKKESAARQADISRLDNKIHDVSKEVDTVGALSMAMSGLHPLSYDEGDARFQLSAAVGTYDGTEALALGGFYHFNRDSMLSVGVATDLGADEHRMGANVGYTRRIGQGGHVSRPSEGTVSDIMKDIKNLEQKQAKLEQENEQLKQQLAALKK